MYQQFWLLMLLRLIWGEKEKEKSKEKEKKRKRNQSYWKVMLYPFGLNVG